MMSDLRVLVLALLVVCCAGSPRVVGQESEAEIRAKVDRLAQPLVDGGLVVGMTVGVVRGDRVVVRGYGETGNARQPVPNGKTVYEIGSVSKAFTGQLLADMAGRGLVGIDDAIEGYLPEGVGVPTFGGKAAVVTLGELSSHTSGLPRLPGNFAPGDAGNPYVDYSDGLLWGYLSGAQLVTEPGVTYAYSNYGAGLLGRILAGRAGTDYEGLLRERITGPLGMRDTAVVLTGSMRSRLSPGHDAGGNEVGNWDFDSLAGAGGIRSTVDDMLVFVRANLDAPDSALGEAAVTAQTVRHRMPDGQSIGLGWHVAQDGVTRWHNGGTGGYHSMVMFTKPTRTAVVVLANTEAGQVDQLCTQILQALHGVDVKPLEVAEEVAVDAATLRGYVGRYRLAPTFEIVVTLRGGRLMAQATGQQAFEVFAESQTVFSYRVVEAKLEFQLDGNGRVTGLVLHQNGRSVPGPRVR